MSGGILGEDLVAEAVAGLPLFFLFLNRSARREAAPRASGRRVLGERMTPDLKSGRRSCSAPEPRWTKSGRGGRVAFLFHHLEEDGRERRVPCARGSCRADDPARCSRSSSTNRVLPSNHSTEQENERSTARGSSRTCLSLGGLRVEKAASSSTARDIGVRSGPTSWAAYTRSPECVALASGAGATRARALGGGLRGRAWGWGGA